MPAASGGARPGRSDDFIDFTDIGLGLRLLTLAVVAGAGALLPELTPGDRARLTAGVLGGAALGLIQHRLLSWRRRRLAAALEVGQVALWTTLLGVTGGQRSPLFAGYLLETAIAGAVFSRRAAGLTAASALVLFVARALWLDPPLQPQALAHVAGFVAIGAILTWILADLFRRQRRRLREYHAVLHQRATTLSEELRLLGDYLGAGLLVLDDMGRIVSTNAACQRLLGGSDRGVGRAWQETLALDAEGARHLTRILEDGEAQRGILLQHLRPDGRAAALRAEMWCHPDPDGRRTFVLLAEAGGDEADDPLRRLGEAVACVAHQFRNSVHALQAMADGLARPDAADPDERDRLRGLLGVVESLGGLSRDVLSMASRSPASLEVVSVAEVVRSAATLAGRSQAPVRLELPDDDLRVRAQRGPLVHALFNLLDNACRVTPPGEGVDVVVSRRNGHTWIAIQDRGPGLPSGHPRGRSPALQAHGAGYGLVAARRFIEGSGGQLSIEDRPGGGSVFEVSLPSEAPVPAGGTR